MPDKMLISAVLIPLLMPVIILCQRNDDIITLDWNKPEEKGVTKLDIKILQNDLLEKSNELLIRLYVINLNESQCNQLSSQELEKKNFTVYTNFHSEKRVNLRDSQIQINFRYIFSGCYISKVIIDERSVLFAEYLHSNFTLSQLPVDHLFVGSYYYIGTSLDVFIDFPLSGITNFLHLTLHTPGENNTSVEIRIPCEEIKPNYVEGTLFENSNNIVSFQGCFVEEPSSDDSLFRIKCSFTNVTFEIIHFEIDCFDRFLCRNNDLWKAEKSCGYMSTFMKRTGPSIGETNVRADTTNVGFIVLLTIVMSIIVVLIVILIKHKKPPRLASQKDNFGFTDRPSKEIFLLYCTQHNSSMEDNIRNVRQSLIHHNFTVFDLYENLNEINAMGNDWITEKLNDDYILVIIILTKDLYNKQGKKSHIDNYFKYSIQRIEENCDIKNRTYLCQLETEQYLKFEEYKSINSYQRYVLPRDQQNLINILNEKHSLRPSTRFSYLADDLIMPKERLYIDA